MKRLLVSIFSSLLLLGVSGYGASVSHTAITSSSAKGRYVTIRANYLTQVVRVDSSGNLIADQTSWDGSPNQIFFESYNPDGTVSFFSLAMQKYVSAHSTTAQVVADAASIGPQQEFMIKPSQFTGWANAGTDEVIFSNAISTDWNIAGDTDGRIFSQYWNEAGGWQNMSVMPISSPHMPEVGVDVSEGKGAQDAGVVFTDSNGRTKDYLDIFISHNFKWVRCRINVNPDGNYGLLQTTSYVASVMASAKRHGYKLLLDFHFSDEWADPAHQTTPAGWSTTDLSALQNSLQQYVTNVMNSMAAANAWPDMIQIGNEVDSGMLWPLGGPWNGGSWSNYALLHNTVYNTVNAVRGPYPMPKVMIHIAKGGDLGGTRWWLDTALSYGMKFDVVGLSYYPMWHGSIPQMKANIDEINYRYPNVKIAIAETAYYYAPNLYSYTGLTYPQTPAGQKQFLSDLKKMASLTQNLDYIFYWGACWTEPAKWYLPAVDQTALDTQNRALFDANGNVLPGLDALGWTF